MHFQPAFFLLAGILPVLAVPWTTIRNVSSNSSRKCGTEDDPAILADYERQFRIDSIPDEAGVESSSAVIQVYFHVITSGSEGNIADTTIRKQIDVLNQDYQSAGLSFVLNNIMKIDNKNWYNGGPNTAQQAEMKKSLRKGGAADLNVYTVDFASNYPGLLGYSTFPIMYANNMPDDGVVISHTSLPGGSAGPAFNLGRTLTHETGHWFGLYHTFQGGCGDPNGDYVSDTPSEASPAAGCPGSRDTCPSAGMDPVHNFMDYSDDGCMNNFTPLQAERMKMQISAYRGL
ncbi:Metalloprotease [Pholiota conissans]|uniref:Metalloprotease n=1 Tax=Pholiota conissans TaxID=109636 RepID=A0A9P5ZEA0_9AGAR|nr:Metalloprotease [Pholiota conissans]